MRTEKEVRAAIKITEESYAHVLKGSFSTIVENAPRALMQLTATDKLDVLFWILGEKRPKYDFEKNK